VSADI